jgi:hypothetical protein
MITLAKCGFAIGAIALPLYILGRAAWEYPWAAGAALIIALAIGLAKTGFWP